MILLVDIAPRELALEIKKEHKEEVKVEKVKVDTVVRPGGGITVDNKKTSRRFK